MAAKNQVEDVATLFDAFGQIATCWRKSWASAVATVARGLPACAVLPTCMSSSSLSIPSNSLCNG